MFVRYLITGGAGFIGSHLGEVLVERGDEVVALDNLTTGRERNFATLLAGPRFRFENGSILDEPFVDDLVSGCDVVVHLAAAVGVRLIIDEPLQSMRTNVRGTEIVLEAAHRHGTKTLIASTSEVYGKTTERMHEQADRVLGPITIARWSYSVAKALDEHMALAYWREEALPTVVVRFFNTVGPRQTGAYAGVLPRLVAQAIGGEDLTIYGDGTQTRCFCDVGDVVRAVAGLLDADEAVGEVFNVGSEEEVTMLELAERVVKLTGSASRVVHIPFEQVYGTNYEDISRRAPDTAKVRRLLAWEPQYDLNAIIKRTIEYARDVGPSALLGTG